MFKLETCVQYCGEIFPTISDSNTLTLDEFAGRSTILRDKDQNALASYRRRAGVNQYNRRSVSSADMLMHTIRLVPTARGMFLVFLWGYGDSKLSVNQRAGCRLRRKKKVLLCGTLLGSSRVDIIESFLDQETPSRTYVIHEITLTVIAA